MSVRHGYDGENALRKGAALAGEFEMKAPLRFWQQVVDCCTAYRKTLVVRLLLHIRIPDLTDFEHLLTSAPDENVERPVVRDDVLSSCHVDQVVPVVILRDKTVA